MFSIYKFSMSIFLIVYVRASSTKGIELLIMIGNVYIDNARQSDLRFKTASTKQVANCLHNNLSKGVRSSNPLFLLTVLH